MAAYLPRRGYRLLSRPLTGALEYDDDHDFQITLNPYTETVFVGVCDSDCGDLDLLLCDRAGNVAGEDRAVDDAPTIVGYPPRGGRFYIRTLMISCRAEPCYDGVGIYAR